MKKIIVFFLISLLIIMFFSWFYFYNLLEKNFENLNNFLSFVAAGYISCGLTIALIFVFYWFTFLVPQGQKIRNLFIAKEIKNFET